MAYYVGVDLGATNLRAVVVGDDGDTFLGVDRRPTPQGPSGVAVTEAVLSAVRAACEDAGVDPAEVAAAGVASIGPLDTAEGVVRNPANIEDVDQIPLSGPVGNLVDAPVYLHNDATAGVIGERFYTDRNPDDMVYLTISSGIGAGVCVDGHVLSGWDGNAGEIGHFTVDPSGAMPCGCGNSGHWEAYLSGSAIPLYARHLHDGEETALSLGDGLSAADVFAAADAGDPFAEQVLERLVEYNAHGVAIVVHAYAPLVVSVGGGVALNNPEWMVEELAARVPDLVISNVPEIRLTPLGEDVVVKGAVVSAMTGGTGDRTA